MRTAIEEVSDAVTTMRLRWARLAGAVCAATALAACGGGGGANEGESVAVPPAGGASAPAISAAATIAGPDGATLRLPEGALSVPPPTVRIAKDASAAPPLPDAFAAAGDVYAVSPDGVALQAVATLRVPIDPATPEGTPVAIAEANANGGWTLRGDTRVVGSMLEVDIARLGHFRVVRPPSGSGPAAAAARSAAPAGRTVRTQQFTIWAPTIRLSSPGFADASMPLPFGLGQLPVLQRADPYSGIERVAFSAQALGAIGFCRQASSIVLDYSGFQGSGLVPIRSDTIAIDPARAGPWAFDVHVWMPVNGTTTVLVGVTVHCIDFFGQGYAYRVERPIRYDIDTSKLQLDMSAPGFLSINTLGLGQVLMANVPFAFAATVPVTLQPRSGSVALGSRCTVGTSVTVEYFDPAQPVVARLSRPSPLRSPTVRRPGRSTCASSTRRRGREASTPASR